MSAVLQPARLSSTAAAHSSPSPGSAWICTVSNSTISAAPKCTRGSLHGPPPCEWRRARPGFTCSNRVG
eukprot:8809657-Alexandrium_andersonii.AAC.1